MPTMQHVLQLIQYGDNDFSIDLKDDFLYIPIIKHRHFFQFVLYNIPYK